jgi:hypothetical protein
VSLVKLTFLDKDGSLAIPEIAATLVALVAVTGDLMILAAFVTEVWVRNHAPDYVNFGSALAAVTAGAGTIVAALAGAQRMRDGLWKPDGDRQ